MSRRLLLVLAVLAAWPTSAFAQHVCDRPEVTSATVVAGTVTISFCYPSATLSSATLDLGGGTLYLVTMTTDGSQNAAGLREFHGTMAIAQPGTYTAAVVVNGLRSPSQTLTVTVPLPCTSLVVKWGSGSNLAAQQAIVTPLYAAGWRAVLYGNGFLLLERCR